MHILASESMGRYTSIHNESTYNVALLNRNMLHFPGGKICISTRFMDQHNLRTCFMKGKPILLPCASTALCEHSNCCFTNPENFFISLYHVPQCALETISVPKIVRTSGGEAPMQSAPSAPTGGGPGSLIYPLHMHPQGTTPGG